MGTQGSAGSAPVNTAGEASNLVILPASSQPEAEALDRLDQPFLERIRDLVPLVAEYERKRAQAKEAILRGVVPEPGPIKIYLRQKSRRATTTKACTYYELVIE